MMSRTCKIDLQLGCWPPFKRLLPTLYNTDHHLLAAKLQVHFQKSPKKKFNSNWRMGLTILENKRLCTAKFFWKAPHFQEPSNSPKLEWNMIRLHKKFLTVSHLAIKSLKISCLWEHSLWLSWSRKLLFDNVE